MPNHLTLVTWGEQITERCPDQVHQSELASGMYQVGGVVSVFSQLTTAQLPELSLRRSVAYK